MTASSPASVPPSTTRRGRWLQPGFLLAAGILAFSAVGLNVAVSALQLHFKKAPVPPARELASIPAHMGSWVQVSQDEPLDHAVQEMLGTDLYVFRDYVDSTKVSPDELAAFDGKDSQQRKQMLGALQAHAPEAVVNCAVTYYTGMVDTVAHIPERCYVADGYLPSSHETLTWPLGPDFAGNDGGHSVDVEYINFEDQTAAGRVKTRVAYCFFADGVWESDSIAVRERLQDLRATHGFYSKVELRTTIPDHDVSAAVMRNFLTAALPQVQKCYPDWNSVEGRGVKVGSASPSAAAAVKS